jgi:hypothetical protein
MRLHFAWLIGATLSVTAALSAHASDRGQTKARGRLICSDNPGLAGAGLPAARLGVTNDWADRIVEAVGEYGEIFERDVGKGSPIKIARDLNARWNNGDLQYAQPLSER